ncbi:MULTISPECIES: hypothetical protein [Nesterenkonia]|nr:MULTISPECIES: hypothetical protein [Nesterenkonia]
MTDAQIIALEVFFIGLIALAGLVIGYVAYLVLSRLYKGQR